MFSFVVEVIVDVAQSYLTNFLANAYFLSSTPEASCEPKLKTLHAYFKLKQHKE